MNRSRTFSITIDDHENKDNRLHKSNKVKPQKDKEKPCENVHNVHNGKAITEIEISPKSGYLVTYSEEDHSIFGWNVIVDTDEGRLEPDATVKLDYKLSVNQICVSDDKKLVYIYNYSDLPGKNFIGKQYLF